MTRHDDWGVAHGWWATDGAWHEVDPDTRAALHRVQGIDDHPDGPPVTPIWFVHERTAPQLRSTAVLTLEDGTEVVATDRLPEDLPLGAHQLRPDDGGPTTELFVVPRRAPRPRRGWGWSAQLYATTSRASWGHGDLADLADLASWTRRGGGELLAHNPLGAPLPTTVQQPSPYYASTRRFWSPLYLRVEDVPGAELVADQVAAAARTGRELDAGAGIDRDLVWALKRTALRGIWDRVRRSAPVQAVLADRAHDLELARFATFCALAEAHDGGFTTWPEAHRHPDRPEVAEFARRHADDVSFHQWLQVLADDQLSSAAAAGAGLMADLPVGFDPSGFDAWTDQDLLASGCRVGAPPDDFSPTGQDWGLPPYVPWRLRRAAYRPWLDTLRRVLRHSAALRIDHVMGLFRLFWIPEGATASDGGYVHHRATDLLDLAVMEATRAGSALVGEDLGTVEDEVRAALGERDVFGYRIGWFADDPPTSWPATTLAALTTHDLPTAIGVCTGLDARDRERAGLAPDPDGDELLAARLSHLAELGGQLLGEREVTPHPGEHHEEHAAPRADDVGVARSPSRSVVVAAHAALAHSGSDLAIATLEDAVGQGSRPNLPGTVDEHPNWRVMLPVRIEDLDAAGAAEIAAVMSDRGDR